MVRADTLINKTIHFPFLRITSSILSDVLLVFSGQPLQLIAAGFPLRRWLKLTSRQVSMRQYQTTSQVEASLSPQVSGLLRTLALRGLMAELEKHFRKMRRGMTRITF
jgi:hypothetical protein